MSPRHYHKTMMNPHFSHDSYRGRKTEIKIENFFKRLFNIFKLKN